MLLAVAVFMATLSFGSVELQAASYVPAKPYVRIQATEMTTNVGQQPKLVAVIGNQGGTTIINHATYCGPVGNSDFTLIFQSQHYVYHPLIPGQNDNFETDYLAIAKGTTYIQCVFNGTEDGTGVKYTVYSNIVKITVQ
jgi:hypothetical protein